MQLPASQRRTTGSGRRLHRRRRHRAADLWGPAAERRHLQRLRQPVHGGGPLPGHLPGPGRGARPAAPAPAQGRPHSQSAPLCPCQVRCPPAPAALWGWQPWRWLCMVARPPAGPGAGCWCLPFWKAAHPPTLAVTQERQAVIRGSRRLCGQGSPAAEQRPPAFSDAAGAGARPQPWLPLLHSMASLGPANTRLWLCQPGEQG